MHSWYGMNIFIPDTPTFLKICSIVIILLLLSSCSFPYVYFLCDVILYYGVRRLCFILSIVLVHADPLFVKLYTYMYDNTIVHFNEMIIISY